MARRFLFVATAAVLFAALPVGAGAQATVPANAYLAPGTYAGAELKSFTARDAQPLYTDALKQSCSNAADVDAAVGAKARRRGTACSSAPPTGASS